MNANVGDARTIKPITADAAPPLDRRVAEAQRLFQRTLASWCSDLLLLRSRGLRAMQWTGAALRDAA